jgi:hypothetical protein
MPDGETVKALTAEDAEKNLNSGGRNGCCKSGFSTTEDTENTEVRIIQGEITGPLKAVILPRRTRRDAEEG